MYFNKYDKEKNIDICSVDYNKTKTNIIVINEFNEIQSFCSNCFKKYYDYASKNYSFKFLGTLKDVKIYMLYENNQEEF